MKDTGPGSRAHLNSCTVVAQYPDESSLGLGLGHVGRGDGGDGLQRRLRDVGVATQQVFDLDEGLHRHVVLAHLQEAQQPLHDACHVLDLRRATGV